MPRDLIVFGAGASFGSDTSGTPPLGDALFDALAQVNPDGWGRIGTELATSFRCDFESAMRELSSRRPHDLAPLQRAMAGFFFCFIPGPSNLYIRLAKRVKERGWNGALATLNYERLLLRSLLEAELMCVAGQPEQDQIEVCMPHGCCHLFCESVTGKASGVSFDPSAVTTAGRVVAVANRREFWDRIRKDAFPPVMSYFEPSKRTTSGVNFINAERERFAELVSGAEVIGIVGLRVRAHDVHIWEPLAHASARLVYCAGSRSGREFADWGNEKRPGNQDTIIPHYFADGFEQLCSCIGLT